MLVLTGQELCTANFSESMKGYHHPLYPIGANCPVVVPMALLKGRISAWELPVNWLLVLFGNLAGALTYVAFLGELPPDFLQLSYWIPRVPGQNIQLLIT
jgi:hypothetical protein